MIDEGKSVLLITPDAAVEAAITTALSKVRGVTVRTESATLSGLNGRAAQLVADKDIIIFETRSDGSADFATIQALATARRAGAKLLALAGNDMTLAQIRALNKAGVDEVLPSPIASSQVAAPSRAVGREMPAPQVAPAAPTGRLIAVAQARGGVGATTVAVNLANELVGHKGILRKGTPHAVAIVDLDVQFGSVGSLLDLAEQNALHQIALDGVIPDSNFLSGVMARMPNGLSVLAAPAKFMPLDSLQPDQIAAILDILRDENDFVVVDLPHALGAWIEPVLKRADRLLIVSDTSVPAIRHCRRLIDFFTSENPDLKVRVVINHETQAIFGSGRQRDAQKALNLKLDTWLPHDPRAAKDSADQGKPLSEVARRSALNKAISKLAKDTLHAFPVVHTPTTRR